MHIINFAQNPTAAEKTYLIEQITRLGDEQSLIIRTAVSVEPLLEELKKSRFQGLSWSAQGKFENFFEVKISKKDPDDCCGCCGGGN